MKTAIEKYIHLLKEKFALDVSMYDRSFLEKSIRFRMSSTSCLTFEAYLDYMAKVPDETSRLVNQLSNSYSEFFRNPLTFSVLEQLVFPELSESQSKKLSGEIRIWSAGCAAGQEPYSLAMLLDNYKNIRFPNMSYRIFATDNSVKELVVARHGVFDFKSVKNTRLEFVEKYFSHNGDTYQLNKMLKEQLDFSVYDLLDKDSGSPPVSIYGDFDLIMCTNVLFYYEPEYQQIILQKIYRSLKPGGFFITGEAEIQIVKSFTKFNQILVPAAVFVKN